VFQITVAFQQQLEAEVDLAGLVEAFCRTLAPKVDDLFAVSWHEL
jgi:hypothetical protein